PAVLRYASCAASNGFGTSAPFDLNPAIAVSIAFSFPTAPVAVAPNATCAVKASAGAAGRRIFAAAASVTWTQSIPCPVRESLSRAAAIFAPSSNAYVRVLRVEGFASSRTATATGMKNSAASGITACRRSYAVPLFATSSKPRRARWPNALIIRTAFTNDPNPPRHEANGPPPPGAPPTAAQLRADEVVVLRGQPEPQRALLSVQHPHELADLSVVLHLHRDGRHPTQVRDQVPREHAVVPHEERADQRIPDQLGECRDFDGLLDVVPIAKEAHLIPPWRARTPARTGPGSASRAAGSRRSRGRPPSRAGGSPAVPATGTSSRPRTSSRR